MTAAAATVLTASSETNFARETVPRLFAVPLVDLGTREPALDGIWMPEPEIGAERIGITAQFLDDAESYNQRYAASEWFTWLYAQALAAARIDKNRAGIALDIGTGSGANSVVPLLGLIPGYRIVASDLSAQLLAMLRRYLLAHRLDDRVACVLMNAMYDYCKLATFDLVVGSALLHHLIEPRHALAAAYRALRPGGAAIFIEPFEGANMVKVMFSQIRDRAARERLHIEPKAEALMSTMITDYDARTGTDKSAERFRYMDDKWLFTRTYIESVAAEAGFNAVDILPHHCHATHYRDHVAVLLRLGAGLGPDAMPDWAWDMIDLYDRSFSVEFKRDLAIEATIVLRRP